LPRTSSKHLHVPSYRFRTYGTTHAKGREAPGRRGRNNLFRKKVKSMGRSFHGEKG